ncbi:copper resistance CopC family protein [Dactylosporangium sp. CA-052675]|uniref:copper resistance CopC family protein n=1 Tax=Dactylosporangium sp. CA-052675 TaxID=3239927 RepID=UPI003D8EA989
MRCTIRVLLVAAALVLLAPATPAFAHSRLVASDPADGAAVRTPPNAVALTFSDGVQQQFSTVVVTGADGASYVDGAPRVTDRTLTQPLRPLPNGAVRVAWRTVSADGHPIEGQFSFTVSGSGAPAGSGVPAATATPSTPPAAAATPSATPSAAPDAAGGSGATPWIVGGGVVIALLAGAVFAGSRRRRRRRQRAGTPAA